MYRQVERKKPLTFARKLFEQASTSAEKQPQGQHDAQAQGRRAYI
jgi:hypothetical protein